MRVERRLEPFGVIVGGFDPRAALDAEATESVRRLLDEHHILVIRGLERPLTADEQIAFMAAFGEVERPSAPAESSPFLFRTVNAAARGPVVNAGTEGFHNDGLDLAAPTALVSYHIIEVAREGGDTLFANAHAAYEALSADVQARIDDAIAIYGFRLPIGDIALSAFRLVRVHPRTAKKALAVALGPTPGILVILGMSEDERRDLVAHLDAVVRRPAILYRHRWQPHDLILSDNAAVVHCGELSDPGSPRVLHRVSVAAEVDFRAQHRFTVLPGTGSRIASLALRFINGFPGRTLSASLRALERARSHSLREADAVDTDASARAQLGVDVASPDLSGAKSFIEACPDERQLDAFRRLRDRLHPAFGKWADEQYAVLDQAPKWDVVLEATLAREKIADGLLCEFGVCTGNSTNLIAKKVAPREVFGFDSFEGLPDDWVMGDIKVPKGFLAIDASKLHFAPNVKLVTGYFCDTLPGFFEQNAGPVALAHIDCDTYESTVDVFKHITPRFQVGTLIVFDEVLGDMGTENELRAFWELLQREKFGFEWVARGGGCWTPETQARFHAIKKNDVLWRLRYAVNNLGSVVGLLRNKKKVEHALSAAALRITSLP